jgi:aminoglycoside/choline kinase family phosphotransferase
MTDQQIKKAVLKLFEQWSGEQAEEMHPLPSSGSYRRYFRLQSAHHRAIGTYYQNRNENRAFIALGKHFKQNGLNVPGIFAVGKEGYTYLQEDLGDKTLFDHIQPVREKEGFSEKLTLIYRQALEALTKFQMEAGKTVDYSVCYPAAAFNRQAYLWDLNYFKYNFLKLAGVPFDEYALEKDFEQLITLLLSADHGYFVYRDFQARNIMLHNDKLWFIDFQGGRKGPVHYDVASLLFQARANIPFPVREELLDDYIAYARKIDPASVENFREHYYRFVLIRVLQTLGAYGFRGLYEKKTHFLDSLSLAVKNVAWLLDNKHFPSGLPELKQCLERTVELTQQHQIAAPPLKVQINSFSYKRGIPADLSGNGGGFVFDCRALPNPGRLEKYRNLTGNDREVTEYLEKYPEVDDFIEHAHALVQHSIAVYSQRRFTSLTVNFGCTGGQHRSVYCAGQLARKLKNTGTVEIELIHRELEKPRIYSRNEQPDQ